MILKKLIKLYSGVSRIEQFLPILHKYFVDDLLYAELSFSSTVLKSGKRESKAVFEYQYKRNISLKLQLIRCLCESDQNDLDLVCESILHNLLVISKLSKGSYKGWSAQKNRKSIICNSKNMKECLEKSLMVAPHSTTVLLTGETGVGKEVLAKYIHDHSERRRFPLVTVNCASLPNSLIDSSLFGHTKGAFTGADRDRKGFFEQAKGGTLFLDEIGDLPLETQSRLLRVIEYGDFNPVGSDEVKKADVRIIAATNVSLKEAVFQEKFRKDLYFRLSVFPIEIPPLRERQDDMIELIDALLNDLYLKLNIAKRKVLDSKFYKSVIAYDWPGNVRELKNTLEKSLILSKGSKLQLIHDDNKLFFTSTIESFEEGVQNIIESALLKSGGKVDGVGGAAELLSLKPQTLYSKIRKYGIRDK